MAQRKQGSARHRRLSRRQFLTGSAAAGVALGLPGWLAGCGDDCGPPPAAATPTPTAMPTPTPRLRETRTLHFDLSFNQIAEPRLYVLLSAHHRLLLTPHTAESRAHYRDANPLLRGVADVRLTHFAEEVDLPADSLQHFWITGRHGATGDPAVLGLQIHVPREVRRTLALAQRLGGGRRPRTAKMHAYGLVAVAEALTVEDLAPALDEFVTPWDTAVALVFHHPEIMNLDPEQGTAVLDLIQTLPCAANDKTCTPFLGTLAFRIANHWPAATTPGGWATLVAATDLDGMPVLDEHGDPVYTYNLANETISAAQQTIRAVIGSIFDDPRFAGSNWHDLRGRTVSTPAPLGAPPGGFELVAEHGTGTTVHGVEFVDIKVLDQAQRTVEVGVKNFFLRSHSVYLGFENEAGPLMPTPGDELNTDRATYTDLVFTNDTLMGIPLVGDLADTQRFQFAVPKNATKAVVHFGSLGVGGDPFCPEAVYGSLLTLGFNIGIPTILLALGVAGEVRDVVNPAAKDLRELTRSNLVRQAFLKVLRRSGATGGANLGRGIFGSADSGDVRPFLLGIADFAIQFLVNAAPAVAFYITTKGFTSGVGFALGPFKIAAMILSGAAAAAEIAQTVVEVLASPARFTNKLSLVMTTTVRIEHDPDDFRFPARARHYEVTLVYDEASAVAHKQSGTIEPARVDPIPVVFEKVPSGGKVTVDVVLTTEEGYIVGRSVDTDGKEGPVGPIDNTPEKAGTIVVPIKERLIPLTQSTRYMHDLELQVENGRRVWAEGAAATATRAELCQGQDDRLCTLGGITVNQRTGMAGYSFAAGGQGDRAYCGESGGGVMHLFQNVFLGENPESGLKVLPCGFRHPAGIVYERLGTAAGRHFFFEPAADGQSYFLESVVLDTSTPFALNNPLAWGRFTQALESVAVVPTGYVVGVSRLTHKLEILQLPKQALDRAQAPEAVPFSVLKAGEGTREGLLSAPVAVAVRDATILVLETGNARIQAFDVSGNPVSIFRNGTSATVELEKAAQLEYLDLAVEGLGYMYVLSAANGGLAVDDYRLDVFTPEGNPLARTTGVAAARLAVDTFRNVYTLNFATVAGLARVEPSLSQWVPSTPGE